MRRSQRMETATEFALVSFFRDPGHRQTLIALQGITTIGTLAAAKFMCTNKGALALEDALKRSQISYTEELPSFEMLLRVCVEDNSLGDVNICQLEPHWDID